MIEESNKNLILNLCYNLLVWPVSMHSVGQGSPMCCPGPPTSPRGLLKVPVGYDLKVILVNKRVKNGF